MLRARDAHSLTDAEFEALAAADRADTERHRRRSRPIRRDEYLTPADESQYVYTDADGLPNLKLSQRGGQLVLTVPQGIVNFRSRTLHRHGIYTFRVRGISHHEDAVTNASLLPGTVLRLVREPANEFDTNAIAIYPAGGTDHLGYVNKQNAARLAPRLDAGESLRAITMSGSPAGYNGDPVTVLVTTETLLAHLRR